MPHNTIIANSDIFAKDTEDLKQVQGVAYSGGPIRQFWSEAPIYLNLEGLSIRAQIPLLYNHFNTPESRLGVITASIENNQLLIKGGIDQDAPSAKSIIAAGVKIPWQLSIGADPMESERLGANQTATINGREVTGPALIINKASLHEVSVVAVGADADTHLQIAASLNLNPIPTGATPMPTNTPTPTSADAIQAAIEADRKRAAAVAQICAKYPEIQAKATAENWDENKAREAVLAHLEATMSKTAPQVHTPETPKASTAILQAAAMQSLGFSEESITKTTSQKSLEAADKLYHGHLGLQDLIIEAAAANGNTLHTHSLNSGNWSDACAAAIRAASGTTSISMSGLLGGIINRTLLEGYNAVDAVWEKIAKITPVKDFREIVSYRLVSDGGFQKVAPNGELKHGTLSEASFSTKADTYGKIVGLTRQDIINDDLGALKELPNQLGIDAALTFNEIFWREFMDNSGFFKNDNKNLLSGNALSVDGLKAAVKKFRDLKDESGRLFNSTPTILLVGNTNEVTAGQLYNDQYLIPVGAGNAAAVTPSGNPFQHKYQPVCTPYLEDTAYTGNSATAYYLLCNPALRAAIQVCFLNGIRTPTVQSSEMDFNTLGIQFRAYFDFGATKMDPKAGIKVTGA